VHVQQDKKMINSQPGRLKWLLRHAEVLSKSEVPPFEINEHTGAAEEIRLKYRYLDLRRKSVFDKIAFRAKMNKFTRDWFTEHGFLEVQTPIFTRLLQKELETTSFHLASIMANSMLSLKHHNNTNNLLMVGGVDKYFQIAPCFRDEDPRADRHSCEFYQIDCEMSFVEQEDVFAVAEPFAINLIESITEKKIISLNTDKTFKRLTHKEAIDTYGSDKPDIRFDMHFEDLTQNFATSGFSLFSRAVAEGGVVKAMKLESKTLSRSEIDSLTEVAKSFGAGGLAYIIYEADGPKSPILKFFTGDELATLETKLAPKVGDMIFFGAGDYKTVCKVLGQVRLACRDRFELVNKDDIAFCWVTDFPMYEQKDDGNMTSNITHSRCLMVDFQPSTAIQIHSPSMVVSMTSHVMDMRSSPALSVTTRLKHLWKRSILLGRENRKWRIKFGAMYTAFQYGVPPHGGFAFGFDRFLMILRDEDNIREIYAFPKSGKAEDAMMNAPIWGGWSSTQRVAYQGERDE
jgi:aspartyl-tRNA synthetase